MTVQGKTGSKRYLLISIGQILVFLYSFVAFAMLMPWLEAHPRAEAEKLCGYPLCYDSGCVNDG